MDAYQRNGISKDFGYMQEVIVPVTDKLDKDKRGEMTGTKKYLATVRNLSVTFLGREIDIKESIFIDNKNKFRKIAFTDGSWFIMRTSGTEGNKVRIYDEAPNVKLRDSLVIDLLRSYYKECDKYMSIKSIKKSEDYFKQWLLQNYSRNTADSLTDFFVERKWGEYRIITDIEDITSYCLGEDRSVVHLAIYKKNITQEFVDALGCFVKSHDEVVVYLEDENLIPGNLLFQLKSLPGVRVEPGYSKGKYNVRLNFGDIVRSMQGATSRMRVIAEEHILKIISNEFDPEARPIMFLPVNRRNLYDPDAELGLLFYAFLNKDELEKRDGCTIKRTILPSGIKVYQHNFMSFTNMDIIGIVAEFVKKSIEKVKAHKSFGIAA